MNTIKKNKNYDLEKLLLVWESFMRASEFFEMDNAYENTMISLKLAKQIFDLMNEKLEFIIQLEF